jgi:hypothetical protein
MRITCTSLLIIGFILTGTLANGQIHLGATTAYNATFVLDKGLSEDPRYSSTYTYNWAPVGFSFGADFGQRFGLQLEAIKSAQGQIYNVINTAKQIAGTRKIDVEYVNIPLMMKFMGRGTGKARGNFNFGPQLGILTKGIETLQTNAGDYQRPEGVSFEEVKADYEKNAGVTPIDNNDGTYNLPTDVPTTALLEKELDDFKNTEFQLAVAFGLDIDLSRHLYLSTQVRANYSLTDMRNEDIINLLKSGNVSEIFGGRANCLVGVQVGLHYYFGTLKSFR